jgi:hypothetical protein
MPRFTFPYIPFSIQPTDPFPNGQIAFRPYMLAVLRAANGKTLRCIVWPDSGADHCLFPVSFAQALGLDILAMKSQLTGGVGSTGNVTYYDTLEVDIGLGSAFSVHAGFTVGLEAQGIGLLGQAGFFERFNVSFSHKAKQFHIDT